MGLYELTKLCTIIQWQRDCHFWQYWHTLLAA